MKFQNTLIGQYLRMIRGEFKGYNGKKFLGDVISGITVGAVALPLALAFGASSVPGRTEEELKIGIVAGLITAILAGIVTGLLGGGGFQISGPTGTMSVILFGLVLGKHGFTGFFAAVFLAGVIRLLCGIFRLGQVIKFIPKPVVTGFTAGIALIIALGQVGNAFGVDLEGATTIEKLTYFFSNELSNISLPAVICTLAIILLMIFYPKKIAKYIPGSLGALIVGTAVVAILGINVDVIGKIEGSIVNSVHLNLSDLSLPLLLDVTGPAISIALLCMIETLLCGTCAAKMKDEEFNPNTELVAQGIGNIIIAFFGGVPSTAALARTSVAIRAGGNTRIAGVFHSLFLLACLFVLSGAIGLVPYSALAGVLIVTAYRMNDWGQIKCYFGGKLKAAIAQFLVTMLVTVLVDLTYAIIAGVALGFIIYLVKLVLLGKKRKKLSVETDISDDDAYVKVSGVCFFITAQKLYSIKEAVTGATDVTLDLTDMCYHDYTVCETLYNVYCDLVDCGKNVKIVNAPIGAAKTLVKIGLEI